MEEGEDDPFLNAVVAQGKILGTVEVALGGSTFETKTHVVVFVDGSAAMLSVQQVAQFCVGSRGDYGLE